MHLTYKEKYKETENNPDFSGDCEIEEEMLPPLIDSGNGKQIEDNESSSTYPSDEMDIPEDISLNEILKLHHEVSEDNRELKHATFLIHGCNRKCAI